MADRKTIRLAAPTALLALTLAACSTVAPPKPAPKGPAGAGAWAFAPASREESAKLGYGVEGTDSVGLMLRCAQPRVRLEIFPTEGHAPRRIVLQSGKARGAYPLARPKDDDGYPILEALMNAADPVLEAFVATGQLIADGVNLDARTGAERTAIRAFRGACPKPAK